MINLFIYCPFSLLFCTIRKSCLWIGKSFYGKSFIHSCWSLVIYWNSCNEMRSRKCSYQKLIHALLSNLSIFNDVKSNCCKRIIIIWCVTRHSCLLSINIWIDKIAGIWTDRGSHILIQAQRLVFWRFLIRYASKLVIKAKPNWTPESNKLKLEQIDSFYNLWIFDKKQNLELRQLISYSHVYFFRACWLDVIIGIRILCGI